VHVAIDEGRHDEAAGEIDGFELRRFGHFGDSAVDDDEAQRRPVEVASANELQDTGDGAHRLRASARGDCRVGYGWLVARRGPRSFGLRARGQQQRQAACEERHLVATP
jgi:hypothetical protein